MSPWIAQPLSIAPGRLLYRVGAGGESLSFAEALRLLDEDAEFRAWFGDLIAGAPFSALRWETPPVTLDTLSRPFEFVLLEASWLDRPPDLAPFSLHFDAAGPGESVLAFPNLGRDGIMIAPCPVAPQEAYGHLAAFLRRAPAEQQHELWRVVAREMEDRVGGKPVWLSTAGGGVAWLHVRLDSRPKYYGHRPYTQAPSG